SVGDNTDQFFGNHNHFTDAEAIREAQDIFFRQSHGFNSTLGSIGGDVNFCPDFAVDLNHHFDAVTHQGGRVDDGPLGINNRAFVPQFVPQVVADVGHHGRQQQYR